MKTFYRLMNSNGVKFIEAQGKQHKISKYTLFSIREEDEGEKILRLIEKNTGIQMGIGKNQKAAIENVKERIEKHGEKKTDELIYDSIKKYGMSPIGEIQE